MSNSSIKPGQVWLDTGGNRIHAHGGSIIMVDDTYYWYGENKEKTKPDNDIWHWGVRCYASKDLYNWEDKGLIIPPEPDNPTSSLHPTAYMDRPHILYNDMTKKYVCWLKIMTEGQEQTETVLVADNILGPYTKIKEGFKPLGMNAGDFDLVIEPTDKKAYYYFERVHSELICADLSSDYTDVTGYYSTHFPHPAPPEVREAPAYFKRNGKHYLFTSGTSGYYPNPTEIAVADCYHGPWTVLGCPHRGEDSETSFSSQISSVFKVPGKKDLYIALADRWLAGSEIKSMMDWIMKECKDELENGVSWEQIGQMFAEGKIAMPPKDDTSLADYVWLPIQFEEDGTPYLVWYDEWRIEDFN